MTVEELTALAERLLSFGVETVREKESLCQQFHLVCADGHIEIIVIGGDVTNWDDAKSDLAKRIRARVKESGAKVFHHARMSEADIAMLNELITSATAGGAYGLGAIAAFCMEAGVPLPAKPIMERLARAASMAEAADLYREVVGKEMKRP